MKLIGSLFSGIGGLELGLERAGVGRVVWQVERDRFCRGILARHWPLVDRSVSDVRYASSDVLDPVDIICAGFPCQDLSVAGTGLGLAGKRSGLWYEAARIIADLRPRVAFLENVAHGRNRWLPYVRRDLETLGYRTRAFVVAASDLGAPHERRRCFVVADTDRESLRDELEREPARWARDVRGGGEGLAIPPRDTRPAPGSPDWATLPALPRVDDGVPARVDRRRRALGNAVVPQVAELVGRIYLRAA